MSEKFSLGKDDNISNVTGINVFSFDAIGDGIADDTYAIINAAKHAALLGEMLKIPPKTYRVTDIVYIACNLDAEGAMFIVDHDLPIAVVVGKSDNRVLYDKKIRLPIVCKKHKDWSINCTGVQLLNLHSCCVEVTKIKDFTIGLHIASFSQGNVHNEYYLRQLDNNKINILLEPLNTDGWVNENNFFGGKFNHNSAEGTEVSGVRHIMLSSQNHSINNNVFYKPSIEGNTPEFHIELFNSVQNMFISPRYETCGTYPKIKIAGKSSKLPSSGNVFLYGYGASSVIVTEGDHSNKNQFFTDDKQIIRGSSSDSGIIVISNSSSSVNPALTIFAPGYDLHDSNVLKDKYAVNIGPDYTRLKRPEEHFDRLRFDHVYSRIYLGNGSIEPSFHMCAYGAEDVIVKGGNLYFDGTWNGSKIVLGTFQLWIDSMGKLRMKDGPPISDTDGTIVGT